MRSYVKFFQPLCPCHLVQVQTVTGIRGHRFPACIVAWAEQGGSPCHMVRPPGWTSLLGSDLPPPQPQRRHVTEKLWRAAARAAARRPSSPARRALLRGGARPAPRCLCVRERPPQPKRTLEQAAARVWQAAASSAQARAARPAPRAAAPGTRAARAPPPPATARSSGSSRGSRCPLSPLRIWMGSWGRWTGSCWDGPLSSG